MILPAVVRQAEQGAHELPPYTRWGAALHELREELARDPDMPLDRLPQYLERIATEDESQAIQDLVAEHLGATWRCGRGCLLETYVEVLGGRWESLASLAVLPAELVEDEFLARHALPGGDAPPTEEYAGRFHGRPEVMAALEGRCLRRGRYVKLRTLGRGAVGRVWEARDRHVQRLVAIKELRAELSDVPEIRRRFIEEAAITARFDHPGIARVHELVQDDGGAPHYVMELVEGGSLGERIRAYHHPQVVRRWRETRRLELELLRSFAMVCDAVAHAHEHGVLHRDLKPGNVMVGCCGETVILDWGMATQMDDASGTALPPTSRGPGAPVGTPEYMPPEQTSGAGDARSDVFGLGAVLYEVLVGCPPHQWTGGVRPADWQRVVRAAQVMRPRQGSSKVPRPLESICLRALALDPLERYPSARAMLQPLRAYLDDRSACADDSLLRTALRRLCRRVR